jgi:hypothetical protein
MYKKLLVVMGCLLLLACVENVIASPGYIIEFSSPVLEVQDIRTIESDNFTVVVLDDQEIITADIVATYDGYDVVVGKMYGVLYR